MAIALPLGAFVLLRWLMALTSPALTSNSELVVLMDPYWGRLSPVQQSTSAADTLLGNAFEPLIDLNPRGGVSPGSADRWTVSDDFREFRFHIRPGIRFSDGTPLTAELYRKALLGSVAHDDKDSHNPNALDVLYRLEGFTLEAAQSGNVPGLTASVHNKGGHDDDGDWLVMRFAKPFRTAALELTGTRYAPWVQDPTSGEFLGTGSYRIVSHRLNEEVIFEPNAFAWKKPRHSRVRVIGTNSGIRDLCIGKGRVYAGSKTTGPELECSPHLVQFVGGGISGHWLIALNGSDEHVFSDRRLRQALQFLVRHAPRSIFENAIDPRRISMDPQFFPKLWPGRIDDQEAEELINKGKNAVSDLVSASQRRPLRFLTASEPMIELRRHLESSGIVFHGPRSTIDSSQTIEAAYGRIDYDINIHGAMVVGSDPDGLYHLLGAKGSLHSPAIHRPAVCATLEHARTLLNAPDVDAAYQAVNRTILTEVPHIHLGFDRTGTYIRTDLVTTLVSAINSDRFTFDIFQLTTQSTNHSQENIHE